METDFQGLSRWTRQRNINSFMRWNHKCHLMCFNCSELTKLPSSKYLWSRSAGLLTLLLRLAKIFIRCLMSPMKIWWRGPKVRPRKKKSREWLLKEKKGMRLESGTRSNNGILLRMLRCWVTPKRLWLWVVWTIKLQRRVWGSNSR